MTVEVATQAPPAQEQDGAPEPLVHGGARLRTRDKRVLVIYGKDESNCLVLCEFLESLGLHPLTFRDLASVAGREGALSDEVVRRIFRSVQATVILLTPDDQTQLARHLSFGLGDVEHRRVHGQARANVYFEAGLAFAQMASRTTVLDLGVSNEAAHPELGLVIQAGPTLEWQEDVISRLMECGCAVELDRRLDRAALQPFSFPAAEEAPMRRLRFEEVEWALESVVEQVRAWRKPDCVIGVHRGGAVVAGMLGELFQLDSVGYLETKSRKRGARSQFQWRGSAPPGLGEKNATLVIGDVLRRREDLVEAREFLADQVRPQIRTATLASCCVTRSEHNPGERPIPDFLGLPEIHEGGVLMPWEAGRESRRR